MAFRTFCRLKIQSTGVPQPLVGSWIAQFNGATGAIPPQATPGATLTLGTMANAGNDAAQIFINGEEVWLLDPNGSGAIGINGETTKITSISSNTLKFGRSTMVSAAGISDPSTINAHVAGAFGATVGSGTLIIPKFDFNNFYFQPQDGATGPFYLGNQNNFTADFRRIAKIMAVGANTQPIAFSASETSAGNPFNLAELWVIGTANDTYTVSLNVA